MLKLACSIGVAALLAVGRTTAGDESEGRASQFSQRASNLTMAPDMIVTAITMSPAAPQAGQAVTFSATV